MLKSVLLFCLLMVSVYGCSKHINGITAIRYDKMNINSLEEDDGFVLENKTIAQLEYGSIEFDWDQTPTDIGENIDRRIDFNISGEAIKTDQRLVRLGQNDKTRIFYKEGYGSIAYVKKILKNINPAFGLVDGAHIYAKVSDGHLRYYTDWVGEIPRSPHLARTFEESNEQQYMKDIKIYKFDKCVQENLVEYSRTCNNILIEVLDIDSKIPLEAEVVINWEKNIFDDIWLQAAVQFQRDQFINEEMYNQYHQPIRPSRFPLNYRCNGAGKAFINFPDIRKYPLTIPILVRHIGYKAYEGNLVIDGNYSKTYRLLLPTLGSKLRIEMSKPVTPMLQTR